MESKDLENTPENKHRVEHRNAPNSADIRTDRRKFILTDEQADVILDACRRGVPETKIAYALSINYRTWMRVRVEDERIASALAETKKVEEEELVSILLDKARSGDTTSLIFALKGRHNYRDHGTPQGGTDAKVNVTINLPAAQTSLEDYTKSIDAEVMDAEIVDTAR